MRGDARHGARQAGGNGYTPIPDIGDDVGLRRLVKQAIKGVQARDIPEADKRAWIAFIEAHYRAAKAGRLAQFDL